MTRTPRFVRIISQFRSFLMAVNRFDGHIQVRNPRLFQRGGIRAPQRLRLPGGHLRSILIGKSAAQAVLADHLCHAQSLWVNPIPAQGRDMRVTPSSAQTGQNPGAQQILQTGGIRTAVAQRTLRHPLRVKPARSQKLTEENQLAQRRDGRLMIPLHLKSPAHRTHRQGRPKRLAGGRNQLGKTLTLRVSRNQGDWRTHASLNKELTKNPSLSNRRIKVKWSAKTTAM